jgi:hypothetical protein
MLRRMHSSALKHAEGKAPAVWEPLNLASMALRGEPESATHER